MCVWVHKFILLYSSFSKVIFFFTIVIHFFFFFFFFLIYICVWVCVYLYKIFIIHNILFHSKLQIYFIYIYIYITISYSFFEESNHDILKH